MNHIAQLKAAIARLVKAEREHAFIGTQDVKYRPEVERKLAVARRRVKDVTGRISIALQAAAERKD
jgi:hypothetical protein